MYTQLDKFKLLQLLKKIIKSEIDGIVDKVMDRYDEEIIPYGDIDDPVNPFECREEFKQFLRENLDEMQGISGNYVLVTSQMTGGPEGRTGKAFIMPEKHYRSEANSKGWDPNKKIWRFSNFPGIPDFFTGLDLGDVVKRINRKLGEAIKKA
jgi:hypothetical protein